LVASLQVEKVAVRLACFAAFLLLLLSLPLPPGFLLLVSAAPSLQPAQGQAQLFVPVVRMQVELR
jgi:hypothetical protein